MKNITLTSQLLHDASTKGYNGFTRAQLAVIGIKWPAPRGWLKALIGKEIPEHVYAEFKAVGQPATVKLADFCKEKMPQATEEFIIMGMNLETIAALRAAYLERSGKPLTAENVRLAFSVR